MRKITIIMLLTTLFFPGMVFSNELLLIPKVIHTTLRGHALAVFSVAISPDGRYIVSGSLDKTVKLWDIETGREIRTFKGHTSYYFTSVAISPDGRYIVSGSYDDTIKLWDIETGREIRTFRGHTSPVFSVAISPDGRYIVSGSQDDTVKLWDIETGREIRTFSGHTWLVTSVAISPDGRYIVSGSQDKTVKLWDITTGKEIRTFKGHTDSVKSVAISPDGRYIVSGSNDNTIRLWDIFKGMEIRTFSGHTYSVLSVAISSDGRYIVSGNYDYTINLWDISIINIEWDPPKKDPFETAREYEMRLKKYQDEFKQKVLAFHLPYKKEITLKPEDYNADAGGFEIEFLSKKLFASVPREKAKEMVKRPVKIIGTLRYYDEKNFILTDVSVFDDTTNEKYALYLSSGTSIASAKPKLPEMPKLPEITKIDSPTMGTTGYIPIKPVRVSEIDQVPNLKVKPRPHDIAVVIGIEKYKSLPLSDYSSGDAKIVKDYLKALGYAERNIETILDTDATRASIEKAIESWLPNRTKPDSRVFVYYSGHGAPEPKTGDAYIVPYDGDPNYLEVTGYSVKRLYEKLGKIEAEEVIVVLDSCFSGAGGRSVLAKGARPLVMMTNAPVIPPHMVVVSSSQSNQITASSPELGHGIFSYYFLKAIKDGKSAIADIYQYIKPLVEDEAKRLNINQTPSITPDIDKLKGKFYLK